MATLERIRNKAGLLVSIVIGAALFAFILGGFIKKSMGGASSDNSIAEIYGEKISYPEFQNKYNEMVENYKANYKKSNLDDNETDKLRQETWDYMIKERISSKEFEEIGLRVSADELSDMIIGNNVDPGLKQAFTNKQGEFDRAAVQEYLRKIRDDEVSPEDKIKWLSYKKQMDENRKFLKYFTLIGKSCYVTKSEAKQLAINNKETVSFDYVYKNYNTIPDEEIKLTEEDYQKYYDENKYRYKQEKSRTIEYVTFSVSPSKNDIKKTEAEINDIKAEFIKAENSIEFANLNSSELYQAKDYKPGELEPQIDSLMFSADSAFVFGPYVVGNIYKLAKLIDTKMKPDSVKAKHILIQPTNEKMTREQFDALVDSIYNLVENGEDFDALAAQYSSDKKSAMIGGSVGWFKEGMMVPAFEKFCFDGKTGDLGKVNSQYGVHIIKIEDQSEFSKRVNVAFVVKELTFSKYTQDSVYALVQKFEMENDTKEKFEKYFDDHTDLVKKIADIKETDKTIAGFESARELVRWAYENEEGTFSNVFTFGDNFVYAIISKVKEKGFAKIEDVKEEMEAFIIKDKKADKIKAEMAAVNAKSINDIASKFNLKPNTTSNISFNSFSIDGAGFEPDVIAIATSLQKGEISKPIAGRAGVFVVSVTSVTKPQDLATEETSQALNFKTSFQNQVTYKVFQALQENADIKDYRSKFY